MSQTLDVVPSMTSPGKSSICLVISDLGAGGAERVMVTMANHWAGAGRPVTVITFGAPDDEPYYPLDDRIKRVRLGLPSKRLPTLKAISHSLKRLFALRRAIMDASPDVVISFLTKINVLTLLATRGLGLPVIVSERNNPARQSFRSSWSWLRDRLYERAFSVVCQTEAVRATLAPKVAARATVIPNPIAPAPTASPAASAPPAASASPAPLVLTAVGRLVRQKGFDLLLDAFARIAGDHKDCSLVIWGEGNERERLEQQRDRLGLAGRVRLPGLTTQPHQWQNEATLLVLSSRYEGFPNVLGEAMAAGLPVVAFDCEWGPAEMISQDVDGVLVPAEDVDELRAALDRLLQDAALRARLGRAARESIGRFGVEPVMAGWGDLISAATCSPGPDPLRPQLSGISKSRPSASAP